MTEFYGFTIKELSQLKEVLSLSQYETVIDLNPLIHADILKAAILFHDVE